MQHSPFVITATTPTGRHVMLNTAYGTFASLSDEAYNDYLQASGPFAEQLLQAGFLTQDAQAEIDAQHLLFRMQREDTSALRLSLMPTYACNCRCAYCYEADKATNWTFVSPEVEQAIYRFVEKRFEVDRFQKLEIEWYGGDPQLCLDIVARMADNLRSFCNQRDVVYESSMLSNCTRIGREQAQTIADAGVSEMLVTIDGPEEQHNLRRPSIDDGNPYQKVMAALGYLTEVGVRCNIICNADKVNLPLLPQLQSELAPLGLFATPVKLNDYGHTFGTGCFCAPHFDLFTHEEFHQASHDLMKSGGLLDSATLRGMLTAGCRFCNGQRNNYFIIDSSGDVYKCDGRVGDPSFKLFNVLDEGEAGLHEVSFDPCDDKQCSTCELLPLCWGNCRWERLQCGMPCHPLRTCGEDYLNDYAACFPEPTEPLAILE